MFSTDRHDDCVEVRFDVTNFGANLKGQTHCTRAIKDAIQAAANNRGGGVVYFPAGHYRTGAIHLRSNVTLYLEKDAVITFSDEFDDYLPMVTTRWEGIVLNNFSPLIYANEAENIGIRGNGGILDGNGRKWWDYNYDLNKQFKSKGGDVLKVSKWQKEFFRVNNSEELERLVEDPTKLTLGFLRPQLIQFMNCKNVTISDLIVKNSPFWHINPVFCDNVVISGLTIEAPHTVWNTDGINPDSCTNVHISHCTISVGDDCIAIKSGRDLQGRMINEASENITITNCKMLCGCSGVAIGSEMGGGVRNITITKCEFIGTDRGIYIKSMPGRGGIVENVKISEIEMRDIRRVAILMSKHYDHRNKERFSERTPVFRNIFISDIHCRTNQSVILLGLPESPIEDITLADVSIVANEGLIMDNTKNIQLINFTLVTCDQSFV